MVPGDRYGARVIMIAAVVATVLLAALAVFQVALAAGAPLGRFAWGGRHEVLPRGLRIGSAVSVAVYGVFGWIIWRAADVLSDSGDYEPTVPPALWVLCGYFGLGVVANLASRSHSERLVMTPVAALLLACCLVIALG